MHSLSGKDSVEEETNRKCTPSVITQLEAVPDKKAEQYQIIILNFLYKNFKRYVSIDLAYQADSNRAGSEQHKCGTLDCAGYRQAD